MRTVIFANGVLSKKQLISERLSVWSPDLVISADGGVHNTAALGLAPDFIIGDMDSVGRIGTGHFSHAKFIRYAPEKDESDLELACLLGRDEGATEMVILGAMGGRMDMIVANLMLLSHPDLIGIHIELWDNDQRAWMIQPPGGEARGEIGDTLSLIPLGGDAKGITTTGLQYPLDNEPLLFGPARGVSNVLTETEASIRFKEGLLFAVHTPGRA